MSVWEEIAKIAADVIAGALAQDDAAKRVKVLLDVADAIADKAEDAKVDG